ncbi:uncharacterized protein LOC112562933 isoform X2 [Pomacea canaliculata]|uniref:uncharacterized protein LOC112562933 isoform X2 n=1 Tax=Pomacea canaliculata TaxID=400727 RepID=UPI000D727264|nr:uncharacterized protein LOC112562933 isoform X2 [Pomacea canaliculata]
MPSRLMFNQAKKECVVASELKKWHNTSCTTDDDCDVHHAACYKRKCRCEPGHFYTTQDTCTNTCSTADMQDSFTDYPDSALRANLIGSQDGLTVEACKGRCLTDKTCLTFDFKASGGLCRLHNVTAHDSPSNWSPKRSKGWTHYQRSCKSTFASHRTWHNLVCDSRVDCPDPYSDCFKGRCVCHFAFNEAQKKCVVARSCRDWQEKGAKSGVYTIQLIGEFYKGAVTVWCDMDTAGGGWLVIQRRRDFTVDFNRSRTEYDNGFGDLSGDFWLGLRAIHDLTQYGGLRNLRVELVAEYGRRYWAQYTGFRFCCVPYFSLPNLGYSGNAGDGIIKFSAFYTYDFNEDGCVTSTKGPWWYTEDCSSKANLNSPDRRLMTWADIGRVTFSEMKIKSD